MFTAMVQRFWIEDDFVDRHAKNISLSAQVVYMVLKRHVNREGKTTIGIRKIAEKIGASKTTVHKSIKELLLYQLLIQRSNPLSHFGYYTVPDSRTVQCHNLVHKELGIIKECNKIGKSLNDVRKELTAKGLLR